MNIRPDERQAIDTSPPSVVIGSHCISGRTPLDALSNFCDRHRWHSQSIPSPNVDALNGAVYPLDRPAERYAVRVTRQVVGDDVIVYAPSCCVVAHPGDYRVHVLPRQHDARISEPC